ncbi:MAG: phosphodiester glycosidase family protein [Bacteroidota bacterium]
MADLLRGIFGPQPVALLESFSARLHDTMSRHLYSNSPPQIGWNTSNQTIVLPSASKLTGTGKVAKNAKLAAGNANKVAYSPLPPGWQAYGPLVNGTSSMARTLVTPDPSRPYAAVALVRMDLSLLQLHMMPGKQEPSHAPQVISAIPNLGMIPTNDQGKLVAAFNGGFKTINGHYGMMVNGVTLLPARPNMGTVAVYRDGHVQIGAWGQDILPSADIVAYRQNCPPLIDAGQLSPDLAYNNRNEWGYTGNTDITWRTGLGITQDGRYLIYAVGNGTSAMTLAQVLKQEGAYAAIQLDINQYYAHFETYQPANNNSSSLYGTKLVAERLLDKMINETSIYLTPNARDFFYLTAR